MRQKFWWLPLVRGIVALVIGVLILGWPQSSRGLFVNFLAMYWVTSGLVSLRWGLSTQQKKGFWFVDALLSLIVGAALLLRPLYDHTLNPVLAVRIFGVIALSVGLYRIFTGYTTSDMVRQRSRSAFVLGLFEVGLGLILLFFDLPSPFARLFAGGWAFLGGTLLIMQSLPPELKFGRWLPGAK